MANLAARLAHIAVVALGMTAGPHSAAHAEVNTASMVIDANTGEVLHEQFADAPRHPASLTKIMTIYLAFREIAQGRLSYSTKIKISERATNVAPSKLELEAGEEIEVLDAIKALVTKSANDVAVALAEHIGGSEADFVRMMNERAQAIGMRSTRFYNASGLPDPRQVTTARDMLTLALRLQDEFPQDYPLFALKSFDYRGKTYRTHNTLMHGFPGMDGIKTGYTKASGFNVVSSVSTDDKHVVAVVFGGVTAAARNAHMRMLLYRTLQKASTQKTRRPSTMLIASPRPASRSANVASSAEGANADLPWKTATAAPPKPAPAPKRQAPPVAAVKPKPDAINAVIARIDAAPAPRPGLKTLSVTTQTIAVASAPPGGDTDTDSAGSPKLDLKALRDEMSDQRAAPGGNGPATGIEGLLASADEGAAQAQIDTGSPAPGAMHAGLVMPASAAEPGTGLGRTPSTLDAQAQALSDRRPASAARDIVFAQANAGGAGAALASRVKEAAEPRLPTAPAGKGFEIQIGAYGSVDEAQARIAAARQRATGLLDGHEHVAMPVQRGDKQIYRARFLSFSEDGASSACLELRRLAIDCFAMKAN